MTAPEPCAAAVEAGALTDGRASLVAGIVAAYIVAIVVSVLVVNWLNRRAA